MTNLFTPVHLLVLLLATVAAQAQSYDVGPFPKPGAAAEFSSLKIHNEAGGPLRTAREDWDGARRRARNDPEWARWLAGRRAELDEWMAKRRDRVEWVAGWWHDFVSPKDGSFLTWTPEEPGPATLSSPSDPRVELTPKILGGWVYGFRSRHTEKVWEAARVYRLTGEAGYAEWAAVQLDFYAANYEKWPIQTAKLKSRLMHQSLDDANVLVRLVNAARLLEGYAAADRKRAWVEQLFLPMAGLLDETIQRIHNIACWQRSAMAQTALYIGDPALWRRAVDGPYGIRKQIEHGVTSEYLWFEQSMGYNGYVVNALLPLFTMASLEGRAVELESEMHVVQNMMLAPILLRFPGGRLPNPADATGVQRAPNEALLASAYRVFPTTIGLTRASGERNWDTLVDPPPLAPASLALPEVESRNLPSSRMAVLRQGPWQVYFHYGQIHASHAQAEALNFEAYFGETGITHDAGTVGYGSPLHTGFYRTGAAHNVPLVNGEGQARWQPGELVAFSSAHVAARQPNYRPGVAAARELRIEDGALVDMVTIELAGGEPQRLGAVLHLQGRVRVPVDAESVEAPLPFWTETRRAAYVDRAVLEADFSGLRMQVTVETPGVFTITYGRSPDTPPLTRDSLYIEVQGARAAFRTTLRPLAPAARMSVATGLREGLASGERRGGMIP